MAKQLKVLVVDDSPAIRTEMQKKMEDYGFDVTLAEDGQAAWTLLHTMHSEKGLPDLIVCDVNMPIMDGVQLLMKLRESKTVSHIPFYIMTSNKEELLKSTVLCLDVTAFFLKPADGDSLRNQLKKNFPKLKL